MSKKFRKNKRVGSVISTILVVALVFGAIGGVIVFARNDTKTISAAAFTRGALNEADGTYVKGKTSIVTEDLFECKGLKVIPGFDNTSQYQVFWYNEDEIYLGATDKLGASVKMVGSVPGAAVYARVVIYPSQTDEDGKAIKDFEIKLWEISKYKKSIKIEVARDQAELQQDLFEQVLVYNESMGDIVQVYANQNNMFFTGLDVSHLSPITVVSDPGHAILKLDCSDVAVYKLDLSDSDMSCNVYMCKSDGTLVESLRNLCGDIFYVDVSAEAENMSVSFVFEKYSDTVRLSEYLYHELL